MTASSNLDLVRSIYAAFERGEILTSAAWAHPEIEFVVADGPEPSSRAGLAGLAEGVRDWLSAWEDLRVGAEEYRELDDERVLVFDHYSGRGKTSGLEIGQMRGQGASLFHLRDGKVTRIVVTRLVTYWDRERAFADLGLGAKRRAVDDMART